MLVRLEIWDKKQFEYVIIIPKAKRIRTYFTDLRLDITLCNNRPINADFSLQLAHWSKAYTQ
jgi:hypothetical protein